MNTIGITNANGIHNGEVTHHHDQVATWPIPANLRVRNIKNSIVPILMSVVDLFLSVILLKFKFVFKFIYLITSNC